MAIFSDEDRVLKLSGALAVLPLKVRKTDTCLLSPLYKETNIAPVWQKSTRQAKARLAKCQLPPTLERYRRHTTYH